MCKEKNLQAYSHFTQSMLYFQKKVLGAFFQPVAFVIRRSAKNSRKRKTHKGGEANFRKRKCFIFHREIGYNSNIQVFSWTKIRAKWEKKMT